MYRTHRCNEIREKHIGEVVELAGWVDVIRDHGGVLFVDLRDYTGITQVVVHDENLLKGVGKETVISVKGTVTKRDESTVNPKIATGLVELVADTLKVLGTCTRDLPFEIGSNDTNENIRLKHRFLDLIKSRNLCFKRIFSLVSLEPISKGRSRVQVPSTLRVSATSSTRPVAIFGLTVLSSRFVTVPLTEITVSLPTPLRRFSS